MNEKLNELRLDAGIARIEKQQWLCVLDKETGMMIDPMIGLEKFAELIVRECANMAESFHRHQYDFTGNLELHEFIKTHFGVEE